MAPRPVAKQPIASVDANTTRPQPVAKDRAGRPRPETQRPPLYSHEPLDTGWFYRNLRKYPVKELGRQEVRITNRSVKGKDTRVTEDAAPPVSNPVEKVAFTQPLHAHESVETPTVQRPAKDGKPKTIKVPSRNAGPNKEADPQKAAPVRRHAEPPRAKDLPLTAPAVKSAAQPLPPSPAPVPQPRRSKGVQALKDTIYLPFRIVNFALASLATVVTLGEAKPVLDYSVERLGESMLGFGRVLFNVLRLVQLPEALGLESPRPRSASPVTAPVPVAPATMRRLAQVQDHPKLPPQERLKRHREATDVPKRTARMTALVINQMGRFITTSVGLSSMVIASMAVTAVMPPLGFVMLGLTALGAWTAAANLKCAAKNYRSLKRGDAALPVGSSAAANAWFRGIEHKRQFRGPDDREAARTQAAKGAKMLTLLNAGVQMGASLASGAAAAPVVLGLFVKKVAPGLSSAVMGWVAETVASRVGARLRAEAEHRAWEVFDAEMHKVRSQHSETTSLNPALLAELHAWGIQDDDLNAYLRPTTDGKPMRPLRPRDDAAGKYLTQMTDQNFAATLLRNAAVTMINFR